MYNNYSKGMVLITEIQATPSSVTDANLITSDIVATLSLSFDRFTWGLHTDHVCSKLRSLLSKLSILKAKLPYQTLRLLYVALADSVIDYGQCCQIDNLIIRCNLLKITVFLS